MPEPQRLVDHLPAREFVPVDEGDRDAGLACPAGAADAVHVGLLILGNLIVDDVGDVVDVDAAGGHIGGHQHVDLAGAERLEGLLAGALIQVAVHRADLEAALAELVGHLLRGALGAGEDHRRAAAAGLQQPGDEFDLVQRMGAIGELVGGGVHGRGLRRLGTDVRRLVHEAAGQRDDGVRHGRREQHRLPRVGDLAQYALDVGKEAEVEHLVGLVEHQDGDPAEPQVALLGQVEQPAGRADHDIGSGAQRVDLGLVGAPAVDGHHRELPVARGEVLRGIGEVARDLQAQFAGGHDHEGARGTGQRALGVAGHLLKQRHTERERLAHAGAGLTDEVVARQCQRQGQFLNGKCVFNALFGQCADYFVANSEFGKCWVECSHAK